MMKTVLMFAVLLFAAPAVMAQEPFLDIELAEPRVDITTGFDGTRVVLFGMTNEDDANVAVTLKGPESTTIVRRKGRALGTWINRDSMEFRRVPSYYDYAVRFSEETDPATIADNEIGLDHLAFYPEDADEDPADASVFRDALIRRMQQKGFYPIRPVTPDFIRPGFFKVVFDLPPGVPTGTYTVEAILLSAKGVIDRQSRNIQVGQVGFNARIYLLADNHSLLYGLASVVIAAFSGWAAFTFLRRD